MRSMKDMKKSMEDSLKDALEDAMSQASGENLTFSEALSQSLDDVYNTSVTENGAVGYAWTDSRLLDINFMVSSLRNREQWQIAKMFQNAFFEDRVRAVKWMFFAGDVRGGMGERRLFRTCLRYLAFNQPKIARAVMPLVPEYTRWDNLFCLLDSPLEKPMIRMIRQQLQEDQENMAAERPVSLLAKWMPSINTSSAAARKMGRIMAEKLHMTERRYRQMLSALRAHLRIVESAMSRGQWEDIDYEKVPSRANLIYSGAFMQHDGPRRLAYLKDVRNDRAGMHASVLFPHDIVRKYDESGPGNSYKSLKPLNQSYELLWEALPDYVQGEGDTICVADGSGSMLTTIGKTGINCLHVANAMAIYYAERCSGPFKNKYITFSERPQMVDLSRGESLREKLQIAYCHNECANTNIQAVFLLILHTAVAYRIKQEELPKQVLILSDMEFDACAVSGSDSSWNRKKPTKTLFQEIAAQYEAAGYQMPRLIFWNICSRTGTIPVKENDLGVALVSGFSPSVLGMVLDNILEPMPKKARISPMECLLNKLDSERYDAVEAALRGISKTA